MEFVNNIKIIKEFFKYINSLKYIFLMVLISSCSTQPPAEIVYGTPIETHVNNDKVKIVDISEANANFLDNASKDELKEDKFTNLDNNKNIEAKKIKENENNFNEVKLKDPKTLKEKEVKLVEVDNDLDKELSDLSGEKSSKITEEQNSLKNLKKLKDDEKRVVANPSDKNDFNVSDLKNNKVAKEDISLESKNVTNDLGIKFKRPVDEGQILVNYNQSINGSSNTGINFSAKLGSNVYSAESGEVVVILNNDSNFGNLVIIRHDVGDLYTAYAHMDSINVIKNQYVGRGDIIGKVGKTGNVKTPQLHFSVREGKKVQDPNKFF